MVIVICGFECKYFNCVVYVDFEYFVDFFEVCIGGVVFYEWIKMVNVCFDYYVVIRMWFYFMW